MGCCEHEIRRFHNRTRSWFASFSFGDVKVEFFAEPLSGDYAHSVGTVPVGHRRREGAVPLSCCLGKGLDLVPVVPGVAAVEFLEAYYVRSEFLDHRCDHFCAVLGIFPECPDVIGHQPDTSFRLWIVVGERFNASASCQYQEQDSEDGEWTDFTHMHYNVFYVKSFHMISGSRFHQVIWRRA